MKKVLECIKLLSVVALSSYLVSGTPAQAEGIAIDPILQDPAPATKVECSGVCRAGTVYFCYSTTTATGTVVTQCEEKQSPDAKNKRKCSEAVKAEVCGKGNPPCTHWKSNGPTEGDKSGAC